MLQNDMLGESFPSTGRWSPFSAGLSARLLGYLNPFLVQTMEHIECCQVRCENEDGQLTHEICVCCAGEWELETAYSVFFFSSLDSRQAYVPVIEYRRADDGSTPRHQISSSVGTAAFSLFPNHVVNVFAAYFPRAGANCSGRLCLILVVCPLGRVEHTRDT